MFLRVPVPVELERLLQLQHGAVSVEQIKGVGIGRGTFRRISKDWHRLAQGLYIAGDVTWHAFVWAALLRGGPAASVGGAAACHLHGFIRQAPDQVTVWTPERREELVHGSFHTRFRRGSRWCRGDLSTVSVEAALVDHASEATPFDLIEAVTRALARGWTTPSRIRGEMEARGRVSQRKLLTALTDKDTQGIQSVLEWQFHTAVAVPHGLPDADRQVRLVGRNRVDVLFPRFGVIVELDGRGFHDATTDASRDNEHALTLGALTLRFTWEQVIHEPCLVARTVERALRMRGWEEGIRSCRDCRGLA